MGRWKTAEHVVGAVHDELNARRKRAEPPDHQPISDEVIEIEDALFLETFGPFRIVVVAVLTDVY